MYMSYTQIIKLPAKIASRKSQYNEMWVIS